MLWDKNSERGVDYKGGLMKAFGSAQAGSKKTDSFYSHQHIHFRL